MATNLERMNELLDFWMKDKTFQRSIDERAEAMSYKFFDGPPFASGSPHYGHLLAGSIKDVIPRYRTMRGYKVKRKRGRDCHGLPVEKAVEKALWIDGKKDIEDKIWIETFVEKCRAYVNQTNADWKRFVDHTARWADIENPYFTMDLDFMESVIWCFSNIYNQNKVYKGFKVQGYCPSCATPLANNEISDGYEDKQDMAITIKFAHQAPKSSAYEASEDGFIDVVAGVIRDGEGRYAMIHHMKENLWFFPGGKVEKGECRIAALKRELKEEIGVDAQEKHYLGAIKIIHLGKPYRVHRFEVTTNDTPSVQESEKHNALVWVKEEKSENSLGFALNINGTIIDDEKELTHDFIDFHLFKKVLDPEDKGLIEGKFNFLAWTTTPWTLPSNMFLAVGAEIDYVTVYDPESQEYYVMAENLLKKYYKSPDQYKFIYKQKGKELKNLTYQPLFDYIPNSKIPTEYKSQFFQILNGDFVSTEDGTGIVHIAPTFGEIDFMAVAELLGEQHALEWLFMPVDEYGCFDEQVPDYQGMKVFDANKLVMDELKARKVTVKAESITHSYPHCRRCHSPLIYKAMSSWFIKEKEMNAQTYQQAEQINFVPETVKNRFVNGLQQAPDWNIARNRYRGSPLPIWQNVEDPEDRFSLGTLDELYHLTKTGSKNLTKNLFIRHGRTDFNDEKKFDGLGVSVLTPEGQTQANALIEKLAKLKKEKADLVFVVSPLPRAWETLKPSLISFFDEPLIADCEKKYFEILKSYQEAFNKGTLLEIVQGSDEQNVFQLHEQIFVDWRMTDHLSFADQGKVQPCDLLNWQDANKPIGTDGETTETMFARVKNAVQYWNAKFATKTLIYTSHNDTIAMARKAFRNFDYASKRKQFLTKNGEIQTHYRDNARNTEVDLHKPYVDSYWGIREGKTYKRIPEVMDCWFESGSMPFGQDHYLGEETTELTYPADFIAEGLDQTRGWFRSLHVVGHAIKGENAFKNVIVNGLILAEDGKKMSKSLQNYPDPKGLIKKRGGDAFRLYTLSAPVVRAEPMRFAEKGVEQCFKDFNIPLENVFKFFETYAKIDKRKSDGTEVFLMRHAKAEGQGMNDPLTAEGKAELESQETREKIIRLNPDIIVHTPFLRTKATAEYVQQTLKTLTGREIPLQVINPLGDDNAKKSYMKALYDDLLKEHQGKRILIIGHAYTLRTIREILYENYLEDYAYTEVQRQEGLKQLEVVKLPTYQIANELDKWILAELHQTLKLVDHYLEAYELDAALKSGIEFIEKLTNWYLRRSRRRFRGSEMTTDKYSAYATLFEVLSTYLQMMAPFTPFITEELWQKLQTFVAGKEGEKAESLHLAYWPFASEKYIDQQLMEEITTVRKAIKLALFIRSKNKIAVKQPLQKLGLKL